MRIVVTQKPAGPSASAGAFFLLLLASAGYAYLSRNGPLFWLGVGGALLSIAGMLHSTLRPELLLEIDEKGIFDRRLGLGKIHWRHVADVQLQITEENRFLCFRMNEAEPYLERLHGAHKERVMFNRSLGFTSFNVDVGAVDVNLLELKKHVEGLIRAAGRS